MSQQASDAMNTAMKVARIYFQKNLSEPAAQSFLAQRGLNAEAVWRFELGFAPDAWRGLVDHFTSHNVRLAAKEAGVITTLSNSERMVDFFRNRFIFPIHTSEGQLVGYGGRIIEAKEGVPKYINTPETPLFQKSKLLYGLYQNKSHIQESHEALLVEGYMDVVAVTTAGLPIALAPMGTALTPDQVQLMLSMGIRKLWLCLDGDNAGVRATERNLEVIMEQYDPNLDVRLIKLPDDHDPDSYLRQHGLVAFKDRMAEAVTLPAFIDAICRKDFRSRPSLEDKAMYLVRMEKYLDQASGALRDELFQCVTNLTGLQREQIAEGKYARDNDVAVSKWHPVVALAARWMWHDESGRIAEKFARGVGRTDGLDQLVQLANLKLSGDAECLDQCKAMHSYVVAHGPLLGEELTEFSQKWPNWRRDRAIEYSLQQLRAQPFDQGAKKAIRNAFGLS